MLGTGTASAVVAPHHHFVPYLLFPHGVPISEDKRMAGYSCVYVCGLCFFSYGHYGRFTTPGRCEGNVQIQQGREMIGGLCGGKRLEFDVSVVITLRPTLRSLHYT